MYGIEKFQLFLQIFFLFEGMEKFMIFDDKTVSFPMQFVTEREFILLLYSK